ncbi:MAG: sodium:solute symporter family protein, partial [Clostridia bacterium]|nr:sodium:solute symporter family protein [Clostridia bacterium]
LLAWVILGRRTRLMSQNLESATMPEFFGKRYGSNALKITASIIAFVFLIPYTASLYNGLSRLFSVAFGIDYTVCIIAMAILTCIYVVAGGYMATAINDFIQGIIMLVGIVAVIAAVLMNQGGFSTALESLASIKGDSAVPGVYNSFFGPDPLGLLGVVLLTSLGTWGLPQMVQKLYAIKNEKAIAKGTIISTVFALVVAGGCYFLGGFGRLFLTPEQVAADGYDAIIPAMISKLPDILIGIVVILVLSASMSTLSSLVLASSSTITLDFLKGNIIKKMSDKLQLVIMRIFVGVFIVISVVIAVYQYKVGNSYIAQLMGVSWGALAGSFLAPFVYALYWKRTTKAACFVSFGFGSVIMIANMLFRSYFPALLQSPINCGAFAMLAGLIIVPIVSLLTPHPNKEKVDEMFACYDRAVTVSAKTSLSE